MSTSKIIICSLLAIMVAGFSHGESLNDLVNKQSTLFGKKVVEVRSENKEIKKQKESILSDLYLDGCRVTQTSLQHIKPWNGKSGGGMYATDVACIKGKSFDVKAPSFNETYILTKKGYNGALGNYIILEWKNYMIVYGHTTTKLMEGVIVNRGQIIGKTNKSGESNNVHLHAELRERSNSNGEWTNIRFDFTTENTQKSSKIIKQRKWAGNDWLNIYNISKQFIKSFEGMRLVAYPDGGSYSIGYGTKSYSGEVITLAEAEKRISGELGWRINDTMKWFKGLNDNQYAALTSLKYNAPSCYDKIKGGIIMKKDWENCNKRCLKRVGGECIESEVLGGLTRRRKAELDLFNKK